MSLVFQIIILASSISGHLWLCTLAQIHLIVSLLLYCTVLELAPQPILANYHGLAAFHIFARLPPALLAYTYQEWHQALRPGEILRTGISTCRKLADQLWQPRSRISLDLKIDLSETIQGLITHEIH